VQPQPHKGLVRARAALTCAGDYPCLILLLCCWCFYLTRALGRRSLRACFFACTGAVLLKATSHSRRPSPPTSFGRRSSPPPLASDEPSTLAAPRLRRAVDPRRPSPPPLLPHARALGWAAVTTSRGRCPRCRGACEEGRENGAALPIAAELRPTPKLSGGREFSGSGFC
jgi:hypothetical protein